MIIPKGTRVKTTSCQVFILHNSKLFTPWTKDHSLREIGDTMKHAYARPTHKLGSQGSYTTEWYLQLME